MYQKSYSLIRHLQEYKVSPLIVRIRYSRGTPTKRQVSKRQVSKRPVSKRLKRQVYKTSGLQNVRFTKRCLQNVRYLWFGGNPQVPLQPCLQAK